MTRTPAEPLADGEMIEIVAEECHHASCANVPRFNPDYSRDSYPWEHCPTSAKDAWRAIARAAVAAYNPNDRLTPSNRESLGGDDLVIRLMYELHAHVPEDQRPVSMSDLSDEQAARARKAVHAVLAEWESAKAALRPNPNDRLAENDPATHGYYLGKTGEEMPDSEGIVELVSDLRDPWQRFPHSEHERIAEILIALNNRAYANDRLREACIADVWRQADENHRTYSDTGDRENDIRFLTLGLTGEAGEVANFVKKRWRDGDGHDEAIQKEIADVCAYAFMLANTMGMTPADLIRVIAEKQQVFIEKMQTRRSPIS